MSAGVKHTRRSVFCCFCDLQFSVTARHYLMTEAHAPAAHNASVPTLIPQTQGYERVLLYVCVVRSTMFDAFAYFTVKMA